MAHWRDDAGLFRELDVLDGQWQSLPETFEIFNRIAWHLLDHGVDRHGKIDIVVLRPSDNIILPADDVMLRDGEMLKLYYGREHDVRRQLRVQFAATVHCLKQAQLNTSVDHLSASGV